MEKFEIAGNAAGTSLLFAQTYSGLPLMTVWDLDRSGLGGRENVVLRPEWLRPLAAWFAGEAEPVSLGDDPQHHPYGMQFGIVGDDAAVVWSGPTWARLRCRSPYGPARVLIGPRGKNFGFAITLSPAARADVAAYLRRQDAERWIKSAV